MFRRFPRSLVGKTFFPYGRKTLLLISRNTSDAAVPVDTEAENLVIVHPCTDYAFKRAFHEQEVVCGFLNAILGLSREDNNEIMNVSFLDKELPSHSQFGRDFIVDILCETRTGRRFLVEMQNDFRGDYATKAFTEFCRLIAHWDAEVIHQEVTDLARKHARANEKYKGVKKFWKDIKTAIVLVITNKRFPVIRKRLMFPTCSVMEPEVINTYRMMHETKSGRTLGDLDARVVLVMLANFRKDENDLKSPLDQWLYAFKDETLSSGVSRIPSYKHINDISLVGGKSNPGLAAFYRVLNKENVHNAGDLETFEKNIAEVNRSLQALEEKKLSEGEIKGEIKGRNNIAITMLEQNFPDEIILKVCKLNQDELQAIKDSRR